MKITKIKNFREITLWQIFLHGRLLAPCDRFFYTVVCSMWKTLLPVEKDTQNIDILTSSFFFILLQRCDFSNFFWFFLIYHSVYFEPIFNICYLILTTEFPSTSLISWWSFNRESNLERWATVFFGKVEQRLFRNFRMKDSSTLQFQLIQRARV